MSKVLYILDKLCGQTSSKWQIKAKYRHDNKEELKVIRYMVLRILDRMDELHYTAEHLSMEVGYSLDVVRELLRGNTRFTKEQIVAFEKALGIKL